MTKLYTAGLTTLCMSAVLMTGTVQASDKTKVSNYSKSGSGASSNKTIHTPIVNGGNHGNSGMHIVDVTSKGKTTLLDTHKQVNNLHVDLSKKGGNVVGPHNTVTLKAPWGPTKPYCGKWGGSCHPCGSWGGWCSHWCGGWYPGWCGGCYGWCHPCHWWFGGYCEIVIVEPIYMDPFGVLVPVGEISPDGVQVPGPNPSGDGMSP